MCPSCKINIYVFFFPPTCVFIGVAFVCQECCAGGSNTQWLLEDHVTAQDRCLLILKSDAYLFSSCRSIVSSACSCIYITWQPLDS